MELLYGDINLDGNIDLSDVVLHKVVSGSVELNNEQRANADCKSGGGVIAEDFMTLQQFLVHLIGYTASRGISKTIGEISMRTWL